MVSLLLKALLPLIPIFLQAASVSSQSTGTTTRYWDCCKPACSWNEKISLATGATPVLSCDINDNPLANFDTASGCSGGSGYMCSNESPWAVSETMSYGYAAVNIAGGTEASWCCACYQLTFTSGPVAGKTMIVQATNTGGDLNGNQFDLSIPGGGFGLFNGCTAEFGTPSTGWGAQYGGISTRSQCDAFPAKLRAGCYWRFDWFGGANNPTISFAQVTCPAALTAKTGCIRSGEMPTGPSSVATWNLAAASSSTSRAASSSTTAVTSKSTTATMSTPSATSSKSAAASSEGSSGTSASTSGTVAHWGQCAGNVWTGGTVCVSPYTCKYLNLYYSQCL